MALAKRLIAALLLTAAAAFLLASSAMAGERVGVVTNIEGTASRSTITILRGLVDVTRLDATAGPVGPAVKVGALERVSVVGAGPVPQPTSITQETARNLASEFSMVPKDIPAASVEPLNTALTEAAIREISQTTGGAVNRSDASTGGTAGAVTGGVAGTTTGVVSGLTGSVGGVAGGLTGTTTGVVGGLTGTATGVTGGLTGAVGGAPVPVVTPPAPLANPVLNTVTNTTSTVTNGLLSGLKK